MLQNINPYTNSEGIKAEQQVMKIIRSLGYRVDESSDSDDFHNDVDCYIEGWVATSIKNQPIALKTGNLSFEIVVFSTALNQAMPGWFYEHKPYLYIFKVGEDIYITHRKRLLTYLSCVGGFDRVVELSHKQQQQQKRIGHDHTTNLSGLVSIKKLLDYGVIHSLEPFLNEELKPTISKIL